MMTIIYNNDDDHDDNYDDERRDNIKEIINIIMR